MDKSRFLVFALVVAASLGACQIPLEDARCPCAAGWHCCATTQTCVAEASQCLGGIDGGGEEANGTTPVPCALGDRCEAENAEYSSFTFAQSAPGYSGTGYLTCADDPEGAMPNPCEATFSVDIPADGAYTLLVQYASPLSQLERGIAVKVNGMPPVAGGSFGFVPFPPTSSTFSAYTLSRDFVAGRNVVVLGPSSGSYDLDYIEVQARSR